MAVKYTHLLWGCGKSGYPPPTVDDMRPIADSAFLRAIDDLGGGEILWRKEEYRPSTHEFGGMVRYRFELMLRRVA